VKSPAPNKDIKGGDVYFINLLKEPFNVREPVEIIAENDPEQKRMLLFDVSSMTWQDTLHGLI
jgi:hypothetical protein